MRLRRLNLSRYGLFTDREIDFGPAPEGAPDLHVIYGPNEAGKSTALAGFLDLLFGFEHRTPYAFLHPHPTMRVEGDLEIGGETRRFVRVRKRQGSLLDSDGRAIPESLLANALGGMTRETYKATFSLDDDTLEAGGEEILKSEGDLGQLLFAGGAGLVELRATLDGLRERADEFHRGKARNTALHELKQRLAELAEEKKRLDTAAGPWAALAKEREAAQAAYDKATAEVAALETARTDARRRLSALPWLSEVRRLRESLAGLEGLPEPPQVWFERIGALLESEPRLAARIDGLEKRKAGLEEKRQAMPVDERILAVGDRATGPDDLRSRYVTAGKDLPRRRNELAQSRGNMAALLRRLERAPDTDPASLAVSAAAGGALGDLIESRSGIDERLKAAAAELEIAKREEARAAAAFEKAGAAGEPVAEAALERLRAALEAAQGDDWRARLDLHTARRRGLTDELDDMLRQLRPWKGVPELLARVETPEREELDAWRAGLDAAESDLKRLEAEKARLAAERDRWFARAGAEKAKTGVADEGEAAALRAARDEAWRRHREALDAGSAGAFEERMEAYDAAADGRLANAEAVASLRQAGEELRATESSAKANAEQLARARRRRQEVMDDVAAAVATMSGAGAAELPPDFGLPRLVAWVERREAILAKFSETRESDREIEHARESGALLRERLLAALAVIDAAPQAEADIDELAAAAQAAIAAGGDRRAQADAARQRLERARAERERRDDEARRAENDADAWRRDWEAALSRCWLGALDPAPSSAEARRILQDAAELEKAYGKHVELAGRIAKMERDRELFIDEVRPLAERVGTEFDPAQVLAHDDALNKRLAEEGERRKRRDELAKEIEATDRELSRARREREELRAEAGRMFEAFGVDSLRAVEEKLRDTKRRAELREALAAREAQLTDEMNAASPQEAEAALAGADRDALETGVAEIAAKLADAISRKQALFHSLQKAGDELDAVGGGDDAARLEQQRRTTLLEIEEGAREWLRVRLGVLAAERALDAWREAHRSPMMKHASKAFRIVSRGAYSRLEAQPADKGEVLVGVPLGGGAKLATELSKGTRFQLYLALRVAGYREFADRHGAVPFVADDIFETFDDFRAEEAFKLFADMAGYGQAIYLSHHRHLCDIAREVCPSVRVHELPDAAAAPTAA